MAKKFYKTVVTFIVLTEDELPPETTLADIARNCDENDWVGYGLNFEPEELTGEEMVELLYTAGSEPSFFNLNDEGNELT